MNASEWNVIYLLNRLIDDVITVARRKSRQFNCGLHVNINHIEFEDNFLDKTA